MTCVAVLQARMGSLRLPRKVLADIDGKPMLLRILERLKRCREVDRIAVATTGLPEDAEIAAAAEAAGVSVFRGAVDDLVDRVRQAALASGGADLVLHCTGDNPIIDPELADRLVLAARAEAADFTFMTGIPIGCGVDLYRMETLERIDREANSAACREHLNAWVFDHPEQFRIAAVPAPQHWHDPLVRLTVDHPEDLSLVRELYVRLGRAEEAFSLESVLALLRSEPELLRLNAHIEQQYVSCNAQTMRRGAAG